MLVLVARDVFQIARRQVFGQTFGDDDNAILFAFALFPNPHRLDDSLDDFVDVHDFASCHFTGFFVASFFGR